MFFYSLFLFCLPDMRACAILRENQNKRKPSIIRTGRICKKIPFYMRDSACRWFIVKNAKLFRSYVKHIGIFPHERNRILIGLCK